MDEKLWNDLSEMMGNATVDVKPDRTCDPRRYKPKEKRGRIKDGGNAQGLAIKLGL